MSSETVSSGDSALPRRRPNVGNGGVSPIAARSRSPVRWLRTYGVLFAMAALYGAYGGLSMFDAGPGHGLRALAAGLAFAIFCGVWVEADARSRRAMPFYELGTVVFFLWYIAMPVYLLWSRGWWGLLLIALLAVTVFIPMQLTFGLTLLFRGFVAP